MRRALIFLAISIGMIVIGSAVCFPGICGCVGWLNISDPGKAGLLFGLVTALGEVGILISGVWLAILIVQWTIRQIRS